jgi:hypothetical protein
MDKDLKTSVWQQFGAAIDMLDNAVRACPDQLWTAALWNTPNEKPEYSQFWFLAYHTLYWLDLYLSGSAEGFAPPAPFKRRGLPETPYTKDELRVYLAHGRKKCQETIEALTDDKARQRCKFIWGEASFLELQIYNMRHVQEHAAQLSLLLGQRDVEASDWVAKAGNRAA